MEEAGFDLTGTIMVNAGARMNIAGTKMNKTGAKMNNTGVRFVNNITKCIPAGASSVNAGAWFDLTDALYVNTVAFYINETAIMHPEVRFIYLNLIGLDVVSVQNESRSAFLRCGIHFFTVSAGEFTDKLCQKGENTISTFRVMSPAINKR